eukprot:gene28006-33819_t
MKYFASLLLVLVAWFAVALGDKIKVNTAKREFIDNYGRTRVFHGVNAVYKMAPWHPTLEGFDPSNSLSAEDAANLKSWGFNVVRLGVMWPGVEPTSRGAYNQTYLDNIEIIVNNLAKQDIYTVLDFHQDLWHRKYCGEGVPDYVFDSCRASEPAGTKPFPLPAVNTTYPVDANGDPTLDSCLSKMFATYYLSAEVGAGFQCLYDNRDNMWDALAGYWMAIAERFKSSEHVLGYELINEPWAGDVYASPKSLLPTYAEQHYLQPMYEYLHKKIRSVDDEKIIFFEGLTISYWRTGFTAGPGGAEYNDRQVMAYHVYCPTDGGSAAKVFACDLIDDYFFSRRINDGERLGVGLMMTEFGAAEDIKTDLAVLESVANRADSFKQSWMYWQFKYYQDITTCTPQGESLYNEDGTVCDDKLKILSRTYPQAVAGDIVDYKYTTRNGDFKMTFVPLSQDSLGLSSDETKVTEIYVNKEMTYPSGLDVQVTSDSDVSQVFEVSCPSPVLKTGKNIVRIKQLTGFSAEVTVEIKVCRLTGSCSCRL